MSDPFFTGKPLGRVIMLEADALNSPAKLKRDGDHRGAAVEIRRSIHITKQPKHIATALREQGA